MEHRDPLGCLTPTFHEAPMPAALSALMEALPILVPQLRVPDDGAVMDHQLLPLGYTRFGEIALRQLQCRRGKAQSVPAAPA